MTIKNEVQGVVQALFGAFAGAYLPELTTEATNGSTSAMTARLAGVQGIILGKDMTSNQVFVDTILANMGVPSTNAAYAAASGWAMNELTNGGTRADVVSAAVAFLTGIAAGTIVDSNYTAIATAFAAKVAEGIEKSEGDLAEQFSFTALQTAAGTIEVGNGFVLTEALQELEAAKAALTAFLVTADGDDDATTSTTGIAIDTDYNTKVAATDALVDGAYAAASTAVKAGLLAAQTTKNAEALAAEVKKVDAANAAIAKVAGLAAAVAAKTAAETAEAAAIKAAAAAQLAEDATSAAYLVTADGQAATDTATNTAGAGVLTVSVDGAALAFANDTILTLTKVDADTGMVSLAAAPANSTAAQVTFFQAQQALTADFITAFNASVAADTVSAAAIKVADQAALTAALLDVGAAAATTTALGNVGTGFTETTPAITAKPTAAEIAAETAALTKTQADGQAKLRSDIALLVFTTDDTTTIAAHDALTAAAEAADFIDAATETAINAAFVTGLDAANPDDATDLPAAQTAAIAAVDAATNVGGPLETFEGLVAAYHAAELADTPLITALDTEEALVKTAQDDIDALELAVAEELVALELLNEFDALTAAVTAADKALTDEDFAVATIAASQAATAGNDVYTVGEVNGTITGFGNAGQDSIFVGSDYVLNTGKVAEDGDNSVLEIFLSLDLGGNTVVSIETSVFGSNAASPELIKVTLTGVALDDLVLEGGLLSIA